MEDAVVSKGAYHSNWNTGSVGENEGTFTESASSSEVLCNWHPMRWSESRVEAIKEL